MNKPKICIDLKDGLADVYAFATLYDFLKENNFQGELGVFSRDSSLIEDFRRKVKDLPEETILKSLWTRNVWPDILLKGYCDVEGDEDHICNGDIFIDHSILKNCVKSLSENERNELKQKYKVRDDLPILVVGCPSNLDGSQTPSLEKIVRELKDRAIIYFVGNTSECDQFYHANPGIKIVQARGVLKDYYAMADASIINKNVTWQIEDPMHNFIEATAGGPLFLISPQHKQQYGYHELTRDNIIRESNNINDLLANLKEYLQNPSGEEIRKLRAQHLSASREKYLPDLLRVINNTSGISEEKPESDLLVDLWRKWRPFSQGKFKPKMRIRHKNTIWNPFKKEEKGCKITDVPQEVYDAYRRGR